MREKLATQIDQERLRAQARREGWQVPAPVEEVPADLPERRCPEQPRAQALVAYQASIAPYDALYRKLAE